MPYTYTKTDLKTSLTLETSISPNLLKLLNTIKEDPTTSIEARNNIESLYSLLYITYIKKEYNAFIKGKLYYFL